MLGPRHAVVLPAEPIALEPGTRLKVTIQNGGTILASFPMASKRGRLAITDNPGWTIQQTDPIVAKLKQQIGKAWKELNAIPRTTVPTMRERDPEFQRATHMFIRGNWLEKGALIEEPGTPEVFPKLNIDGDKATRLDLAKWIASEENPLTARVAVNRFWLEMFGTGIVPTPEDFGSAGEKPSHPELLDTLSVRFANEMKGEDSNSIRVQMSDPFAQVV